MPNIQSFDAPALDIRPTEIGVEATAAAARRGGAFFNAAGEAMNSLGSRIGSTVKDAGEVALEYEDHREISAGAPAFAQMQAGLTQKWNDLAKTADPNDPSVAAKFKEEVLEPTLQKFASGFGTQRSQQWAESHVDSLREHMFHKTAADMSSLAGEAAKVNYIQTANTLANAARMDPSSVDFNLKTAESAVGAMVDSSPTISPIDAARVKGELLLKAKDGIVKGAVLGMLEKNPDTDLSQIEKRYGEFLKPGEIQQLAKAQQYYKRLDVAEQRNARVMQDYNSKIDFHQEVNNLETEMMPKKVGDAPTLPDDFWDRVKKLSDHPGAALEPGRLRSLITQAETITDRLNKPEPLGRISHTATMDLLTRMRATDATRLTSNDEIYKAYGDGKLNRADFTFLNNEFNQARTPTGERLDKDRAEFFKKYAATVDGAMDYGGHSALGSQRMYAFEMDARRQEEDLRKQGKDPHSLYDPSPNNPNFIGKQVGKYQTTLSESMEYNKKVSEEKKKGAPAANTNLTGPGKDVLGSEVIDIPRGMSPAEAMKKYKSGSQIRLPDGRVGTVP